MMMMQRQIVAALLTCLTAIVLAPAVPESAMTVGQCASVVIANRPIITIYGPIAAIGGNSCRAPQVIAQADDAHTVIFA